MTAIIEIPDELYRSLAAKTARRGCAVADLTLELYRQWLNSPESPVKADSGENATDWLGDLMRHAIPADVPGPTAREILQEGRDRLELR